MPEQLFISDLHLCDEREDIWNAFEAFCATEVADGDSLYILGDLSEYWIGDDDDSPHALRLNRQLKGLSERSVQLAFMRGNRDFLMGNVFCNSVGMRLLPDPCTLDCAGGKVLLTHGDLLCTLDDEYMRVRRRFRELEWQRQFLGQSLDERRAILARLRTESGQYKQQQSEEILDAVPDTIRLMLQSWGVDTMIHGHTHRPGVHSHEVQGRQCRRYVLSDWRPKTQFLRADATSVEVSDF